MPVKYIQRDNGQFGGSVGEGKDKIPSPSTVPANPIFPESSQSDQVTLDETWRAFKDQSANAPTDIDISIFSIDDSFPVPQANSLAKVAAAVDAIEGGADTDEAVAMAIEVSPRQGAYYANAAGYLGLVSPVGSSSPRQWALTPAGIDFLNGTAKTRAAILSHVVSTIPEIDSSLNDGAEVDELLAEKLGESTASRRAATLESWLETLTDSKRAEDYLTLESDGVRKRIDAAKAVAVRAREEAKRRAKIERPTNICSQCFMAIPATGICSNCED